MNAGSCRRLTGCLSQFRLAAALHGPAGNPISDLLHAKHIVSAELWPVPIYATLQELLWWHELGFKWLPCHLHAGPFAAGGLSDRPCHLCPWCWNDPWWIYLCFYPTASIKADTLIFPTTIQGLKSCQQIRAPNWYESVACQLTNHVIKRSQRGLRNGAGPCLCSWAAMLPLDKPTPAPPPPPTPIAPLAEPFHVEPFSSTRLGATVRESSCLLWCGILCFSPSLAVCSPLSWRLSNSPSNQSLSPVCFSASGDYLLCVLSQLVFVEGTVNPLKKILCISLGEKPRRAPYTPKVNNCSFYSQGQNV